MYTELLFQIDEADPESAVALARADIKSIKAYLNDLEHFYEHHWTSAYSLKNPASLSKLGWLCRLASNQIAILKAEIRLEEAE